VRKQLLALIVVSAVAMLAGSFSVYAQSKGSEMVAKVSFEFKAGEKMFPAGTYRFARRSTSAPSLVITPEKGGESTMVAVVTRLAQRVRTSAETEGSLVFDKVGQDHVLSEVWMPGQDGFLVGATTGEHQHEVVPVTR
jgi:hypothetical protein